MSARSPERIICPHCGKPVNEEPESRTAEALEVLSFLNEKTGRNYRPVEANIKLIRARLREGATVSECRKVVAKKCREWRNDPVMAQYLRPATLFNATKFAQYIGEIG